MYNTFFGLSESPFESTTEPKWYFATPAHEEAVVSLRFTVTEHKGCCLVTGPPGTGKTMTVNMLLDALEKEKHNLSVGQCIATTDLQPGELLRVLRAQMGEACDTAESPAELLARLRTLARDRAQAGEKVVLVVEDAQKLRANVLSTLTTLASMDSYDPHGRLISIMLTGDDPLRDMLAHSDMTGMRQHLFRACRLKPLSSEQTAAYVQHRLAIAGSRRDDIFGAAALTAVHQITGGVPRLINHLCDNALISSYADAQPTVKASTLREVAEEVMLFASPETQDSSESGAAPERRRRDTSPSGIRPAPLSQAEHLAEQVQDRVQANLTRPIHDAADRLGDSIEDARGVLAQVEHASNEAADIAQYLNQVRIECAPLVDAKDRDLKTLADQAQKLLSTSNQIRRTFRHMVKAMRLAKQQIESLNAANAMGHAKIQEFAELQRWADRTLAAVKQAGVTWQREVGQAPKPIIASPPALLEARREKARLALARCTRVLEMLRSTPDLFDGEHSATAYDPLSANRYDGERITRDHVDRFADEVRDAREKLQLKTMPVTS